jgi:ABC-type Fe3+-hydroxamate transport system substrate-binding protein
MPGIPSVGGPKTVDAKRFCDLKPSHVLICPEENSKDILPLIKSCNAVPVLVHPKTPEDNLAIFDLFAQTFHCHDKANELSKDLEAALALAQNMKSSTPSLCVLPLIWKEPWMTVSAPTYAGSMLRAVGMTLPHTASDDLYPTIDDLGALASKVDAIALTTEPYTFTEAHCPSIRTASGCPQVHILTGEALAWYGSYAIPALHILLEFKAKLLDALTQDAYMT